MTQTTLTREQVTNAEPGTDLNVMVAEHVFGWRRILGPDNDYDGPVEYGEVLVPPNMSEAHAYATMPPRGMVPLYIFVNREWSLDMSAAWEVVGAMKKKNWQFILATEEEGWEATFYWDAQRLGSEAISKVAPEAICKAALLAVLDI